MKTKPKKRKVNDTSQLDPIAYQRFVCGESLCSIAKDLGLSRQHLTERLKEKYGICPLKDGKKQINSNYFSILNRETAYWLGLIVADGTIDPSHNRFEITLKDKEHIELLKSMLHSDHKINVKIVNETSYYRLNIHDEQIVHDLLAFGVLPNKSNVDFHLPNVPDELFSDFLRGLIDGDGFYYNSKSDKSRFHIRISIGFNCKSFAIELKDRIESMYGIKVHLSNHRTCQNISIFKRDSIKIVNELFKDTNLYMQRKYEKCQEYLN